MKLTTELTGFKEFRETLKDLPNKVENRILQKATLTALRSVRKTFQAAAPRDESGQSPASKTYGRGRANIKVMRLRKTRRGEKGARITTGNAFWLFFFERGTRHQEPRPFFLPTFNRLQNQILSVMAKAIGEGIEREAKK